MMNDHRLQKILESKPPHLSGEAAQRIEARVAERMERGARRPRRIWALALAPALLILLALLWLLPRGENTPELFMVDEEQFVAYLGQWENSGGDLNEILQLDYELGDDDWSSEQREFLIKEMNNFSLDTI